MENIEKNLKGFTVMSLVHKFGLRTNEESDVGIFNPKFVNFNLVKSMHQSYLVHASVISDANLER